MKKLTTLLVMLLFTAGMAIAQSNEATIEQLGNSNTSDIEQTVGFSDGHLAETLQDGNNNFSNIFQEQTSAEAYVEQLGNNNISDLKQAGANNAHVSFEGNQNILGSYNSLGSGVAFQKNGTGSFSTGFNLLLLDVFGNKNTFGLDQEGGTESDVIVDGNLNSVNLFQRDNNTSNVTTIDIDIVGDSNTIDVNQGSLTETNNETDIDIMGDFNTYMVTQSTSNNIVDIDAVGNGNSSTVIQN